MHYLVGLLMALAGVLLVAGNRWATYLLLPDAWFWQTFFDRELSPVYRKTQGYAFIVVGVVFLLLEPLLRALLA